MKFLISKGEGLFLLLFSLFALILNPVFASEEALLQPHLDQLNKTKLWENPTWLTLLRYKKTLFGGFKSQIDGPNFFLSKNGKTNAKQEMFKNLSVFIQNKKDAQNVYYACYFPNRYEFLTSQLKLSREVKYERDCPLLNEFLRKLESAKLSLVFSSYFVSRPASAFGHTFLRFHKSKEKDSDDLLDYIVNFSGTIDTKNPIAYGLKGLLGGFRGVFTVMQYYYKIREYNDFESRDLWQYDLNYTPEDISIIVKNIWEMRRTFFDYYYLDENCSYQLLSLLDLVGTYPGRVRTHFADEQKYFFVAPIDTVKSVIQEKKIFTGVNFRPAKKTQMQASREILNEKDKLIYKNFIQNFDTKVVQPLEPAQAAKILDAGIDYFDFKHAENLLMEDQETLMRKNKILLARARTKMKLSKSDQVVDLTDTPHLSHDSSSLTLGAGAVNSTSQFTQLTVTPAYHSLLDPPRGMPRNTIMEMVKFDLRIEKLSDEEESSLHLEKLSIVNASVMQDVTEFEKEISYGFDVGLKRLYSSSFYGRNSFYISAHSGLAFSPWQNTTFFSSLFVNLFKVDQDLGQDGFIFQYGPKIGFLDRSLDWLHFSYELSYLRNLDEYQEFNLAHDVNLRFHLWDSHDLSVRYQYQDGLPGEYILGLISFF